MPWAWAHIPITKQVRSHRLPSISLKNPSKWKRRPSCRSNQTTQASAQVRIWKDAREASRYSYAKKEAAIPVRQEGLNHFYYGDIIHVLRHSLAAQPNIGVTQRMYAIVSFSGATTGRPISS